MNEVASLKQTLQCYKSMAASLEFSEAVLVL